MMEEMERRKAEMKAQGQVIEDKQKHEESEREDVTSSLLMPFQVVVDKTKDARFIPSRW